jgi:hypothetical protein
MGCDEIRPLRPGEAVRTLVHRLGPRVDRLRQRLTKFGLRSDRVFLVWTRYTGEERGEGREEVIAEVEILPTPKVGNLTSVTNNPFSAGTLPVGAVRVNRISSQYSGALLEGKVLPVSAGKGADLREPYDFFYELVDDDRDEYPTPACRPRKDIALLGKSLSRRSRYRVLGGPSRGEGEIDWTVYLERASEDRLADGSSALGDVG